MAFDWGRFFSCTGKVYDLEDFLERILKGEELPEIGVGENYFVSNCIWNVSSLASGTYAVRATAVKQRK